MAEKDPFANLDAEHTIIMPTPGGRSASRPKANDDTYVPEPRATTEPTVFSVLPNLGLNPLLGIANPLLIIIPQLRASLKHPDPAALRDELTRKIKQFEQDARMTGIAPEKVIAARYMLCTVLDEMAASTPWGSSGFWGKHSLLVIFHGEAWGGEKFFQLLAKLAENIPSNRDILELVYVCLALGFQGRYRVVDNGLAQLEQLRERLAQMLQQARGEYERDLSPRWQPASGVHSKVLSVMPLWISLALCGVVMSIAYLWFSYEINVKSDPVYAQVQALALPEKKPVAPAVTPRLAKFLAPEVQQKLVSVLDQYDRSTVTLLGDGVFLPGSASVSPEFLSTLNRVAAALQTVPGKVTITGHTDNVPMRSLRYPSNWHLSKDRAQSVMDILQQQGVPLERMSAEGRADAEPIDSNATKEGRARNRRIEIILFVVNK